MYMPFAIKVFLIVYVYRFKIESVKPRSTKQSVSL